jgi:hypothetical protein
MKAALRLANANAISGPAKVSLERAARAARKGNIAGYLNEIMAAQALSMVDGKPVLTERAMLVLVALLSGTRPVPLDAQRRLNEIGDIIDAEADDEARAEKAWLDGPK